MEKPKRTIDQDNAYIGETRTGERFLIIQEGAGSAYYRIDGKQVDHKEIFSKYETDKGEGNPIFGITEEFAVAKPKYDRNYLDKGKEKNFANPKCKHQDNVMYDCTTDAEGKINAVKHVCVLCGKISQWSKTHDHTVGGGFKYEVKF